MTLRPDPAVGAQAREWFVRLLEDEVDPAVIAEWQAWLSRSPAHRAAYDRVTEAWMAGGEGEAPRAGLAELTADRYDGAQPVARWRVGRRRAPALIAAGLAAALALGAGLATLAPDPVEAQAITTARAEHKQAALPDGSKIAVGAMTGVQVRLSDERREIRLDKGEAFFRVAHDRARPFVVKTPFGAVTAVGTAFNVDVGKNRLCLNVTEGMVVVRPQGLFSRTVRVAAGQSLVVDTASGSAQPVVSAAASPVTWPQGRLEYRGEPLRTVVEDVNRYAEHPVVLRDPAVGDLSYTGTVKLDAAADWARGLPAAFPVEVTPGQGGVIVLSARS